MAWANKTTYEGKEIIYAGEDDWVVGTLNNKPFHYCGTDKAVTADALTKEEEALVKRFAHDDTVVSTDSNQDEEEFTQFVMDAVGLEY